MLALLFLNRLCVKKRRNALNKEKTSSVERKQEKTVYCRTCLNTDELVPIFHSDTSSQKRSEQLQLVTGLEIQINDGLSQKICTQCVEVMNVAIRFRRTSRKAEKALLNMSVGIPPKIKLSKSLKVRKFPKKQKLEPADTSGDYNCDDSFIDDYQNDHDYLVKDEDTKPNVKQFSKAAARPRRRGAGGGALDASPYKCHTCNKEFKMKATFNSHMRFHTNYCVCESCGKRCRNNNQLQEHKRARHGLGRIHKCAYCEYASATKEALTIHERRHTGERPYICDHCGASFHRRANLVQHIAIHLPDKNFQCDMCPKRLKSRKFLQIHKHNAHTGKRYGYLCPVCAHRFEKPNKARAHSRRVHGLPDDQLGQIVRVQL